LPQPSSRWSVVDSGGLTTSWFGMKGTEDLGGGLKAHFNLTSFIKVDTGTQGRFANDTFFSRDANVSLSGGFGSVLLGRWMAPNFLPSVVGNPLGDSFTFSPLILHKDVPLFNGTGWRSMTPADTGWSNQIVYSTPRHRRLQGQPAIPVWRTGGQERQEQRGRQLLLFWRPADPDRLL
jgi:predicted porin